MSLESSIVRDTAKLSADVDNLKAYQNNQSDRIDKLCDKIEPVINAMSIAAIRMEAMAERSKDDGVLLKEATKDIAKILSVQEEHGVLISSHSDVIKKHVKIVDFLTNYKTIIISVFTVAFFLAGSYYAYDKHQDANKKFALEMKKLEMETTVLEAEIYQKKKKQEIDFEESKAKLNYNREKYIMRQDLKKVKA